MTFSAAYNEGDILQLITINNYDLRNPHLYKVIQADKVKNCYTLRDMQTQEQQPPYSKEVLDVNFEKVQKTRTV